MSEGIPGRFYKVLDVLNEERSPIMRKLARCLIKEVERHGMTRDELTGKCVDSVLEDKPPTHAAKQKSDYSLNEPEPPPYGAAKRKKRSAN